MSTPYVRRKEAQKAQAGFEQEEFCSEVGRGVSAEPRCTWLVAKVRHRDGSAGSPRPTLGCTRQSSGFTLLEMIGVLAIMSILAAVLVPSILKSIEYAALKAEAQTLQNLGESLRQYLKSNSALPVTTIPPGTPNWTTQLATFSQLSPSDIANTRWGPSRTYVVEPYVAPARPTRAMLLSSMRTGQAVPTAASINASVNYFNDIWNTADGSIPSGASAGLWGAWSASTAQFLTIQRVTLSDINTADLQTFTIALNNRTGTTVGYRFTEYTTGIVTAGTISATLTTPVVPTVHPRDKLELYRDSARTQLDYTYIFSAATWNVRTFDFQDTTPPTTPRWYAK